MSLASTSVLFGESHLNARRKYLKIEEESWNYTIERNQQEDHADNHEQQQRSNNLRPPKGSLKDFFFGFLYEDEIEDKEEEDILYSSVIEPTTHIWNPLNASLFASLVLSSFADAVPVALVPYLSTALVPAAAAAAGGEGSGDSSGATTSAGAVVSAFAPRATVAAVLGTSVGKLINGPVGDVFGARRTSTLYSVLLSLSLVLLACSTTVEMASWAVFLVEFSYSVQWPCVIVTLATHYRGDANGMYEGGIYVTSLAARLGSLVGIPTCSLLLRHAHWRLVAFLGAWVALMASSVTYLYVNDSPGKPDDPQNPVDQNLLAKWFPDHVAQRKKLSIGVALRMVQFIVKENVFPSMRHILCSGTFWIVALAHTGASMVRTSERVIGTYLYETSNSTLSENRSAGLSVFLSVGTVAGLIIAGNMFASRQDRERKWLVSRLYMVTIAACYTLAIFAIPSLRYILNSPELVTAFQVMAITTAGFGIAVQFYHIPSLVGATFGCDKGLFSSYSDGVAYGVASVVWRIVGNVVEHGSVVGGGWAYGWAAVALLLILTSVLMVEFMEHYFCRHRHGGSYETIIFV